MEPKLKDIIRPRVIVAYPSETLTERKTVYAAGYIDGYGGGDILVIMPIGRHEFSRKDGKWLAGDCLNYKDGVIMDFDRVEQSIQGGQGGDVAAHEKSLPMCVPSA